MCEKGKLAATNAMKEAASDAVREIRNSPSTISHIASLATEAATRAVSDKFASFGGQNNAKSK